MSFCQLSGQGQAQSKPALSEAPAGQQLFSSTCAGCHGLDGRGGEHAANIATNNSVQRLSDRDLARIVRNGFPASGMPGFASRLDNGQIDALIKYLRSLQGQRETVPVPGDPTHGRTLFFGNARCSECHMVDGEGGFLGADLSGYGKTHSPAGIRDAILNPNKNLDPSRGTVVVVTRAGKKLTGLVRNEDNFSLQLQTEDGDFHLLNKSELAQIDRQARSIMPTDYGSRLAKTDLDDLISFLVRTFGTQAARTEEDDDQ